MSAVATGSLPVDRVGAQGGSVRAYGGACGGLAILHLITRLERGGSSECTLMQAVGAARRGHRVTVASGPTGTPTDRLDEARGTPGLRFAEVRHLTRRPDLFHDPLALIEIVRLLRHGRFDIIHTHTSKAGALGRIAALLIGRSRVVIHQPHGHLFYGYFGRLGTALVVYAERILARLARRQIALSWRGAEEHFCRGVGEPGSFAVIRSGIDLRPFRHARTRREACRARLGLQPGDFAVGSLCRLEPIKGVEDLLDGFLVAAKKHPHLRLVLAGDGPLSDRLRLRADAPGGGSGVLITGSWAVAEEILPALDLFVLASRNEGMGRALVQAMACGLPVVATAVGGVPEILEEGYDGVLVPPGDPEAIAFALSRLVDSPEMASSLGRRGRRRSIVFGAARMNRALMRLYREVA